jgi:hypothetical protein
VQQSHDEFDGVLCCLVLSLRVSGLDLDLDLESLDYPGSRSLRWMWILSGT